MYIFSLEGIPLRKLMERCKTSVAEGVDQVDKESIQKHLEKVTSIVDSLG